MDSIINLVEEENRTSFNCKIDTILRNMIGERLTERAKSLSEADVPDPASVAGTLEDPVISQGFSKEYFFKRFTIEDKEGNQREILIKRVGLGQNAPSIAYVDGIRYEVFMTPQQAERETQRAIEDGSFDLIQQKKEEKKKEAAAEEEAGEKAPTKKPAEEPVDAESEEDIENDEEKKKNQTEAVDFLASIIKDREPKEFIFDNGETKMFSIDEAANTLESIKMLNNENQSLFMQQMRVGLEQYKEMLDFLMDRIRKGVI